MDRDEFERLCQRFAAAYEQRGGLAKDPRLLQRAMDELHKRAMATRLYDAIGIDAVQKLMSEAFGPVRKRMGELN